MSRSRRRAELRKLRQERERNFASRDYLKEYFTWLIELAATGWKYGQEIPKDFRPAPLPETISGISLQQKGTHE